MPLPPCTHCGKPSEGFIKYPKGTIWVCPACYRWGERYVEEKFGDPTRGDLFTPDDA